MTFTLYYESASYWVLFFRSEFLSDIFLFSKFQEIWLFFLKKSGFLIFLKISVDIQTFQGIWQHWSDGHWSVTSHTAVGKIYVSFFLFCFEGMLSLVMPIMSHDWRLARMLNRALALLTSKCPVRMLNRY